MSTFGDELARLMAERGTGVRELARACYVNPGHVSKLRGGTARPSLELADQIDRYLGAGDRLSALAPQPEISARIRPPVNIGTLTPA